MGAGGAMVVTGHRLPAWFTFLLARARKSILCDKTWGPIKKTLTKADGQGNFRGVCAGL